MAEGDRRRAAEETADGYRTKKNLNNNIQKTTIFEKSNSKIYLYLHIKIISKTLNIRNKYPQIWKNSIPYHVFAQK
jgi:hypothetical protein